MVAYRDDRQALSLAVAELERENATLKQEIASLEKDARRERDEAREHRRSGVGQQCVMCGGAVFPVAVFAGRDHGAPIPLSVSTVRFGDPRGGFTRSAPVKSLVCSSCGFIHTFLDIAAPEAAAVAGSVELDASQRTEAGEP